jgi:ankyrin repeat protein
VTVLIARGANIEGAGTWGRTALHNAAEEGHEEVVAWLLDKGADARSRDDNGMTPLIMASGSGHPGVLKMLYQHMQGQGLDDGDDQRWTALHFSASVGREEAVRSLLLAGADPTVTDDEGRAPRALAEENDFFESIRKGHPGCVAVFQVRSLTC